MDMLAWIGERLDLFLSVLNDPQYFRDILRNGGVVAGIGLVGSLGVLAGTWLWRRLAAWLNRRVTRYAVDVGPWPLEVGSVENVKLRCLLVRYGTDPYIERMASDQEKYEGRLRNRILTNRVTITRTLKEDGLLPWLGHLWKCRILSYDAVPAGSTNIVGKFLLPVHQRLGTQFKLFFQIKADDSVATEALPPPDDAWRHEAGGRHVLLANMRSTDPAGQRARAVAEALARQYGLPPTEISEVPEYRRWLRFRAPAYRFHLWFCLESFGRTKTVEGFTNNMCMPV